MKQIIRDDNFWILKQRNFNLAQYKELLDVEKNDKFDSFVDPNFVELLSLEVSIQSQISYNRREDYFSLIEKYLVGKIEIYEFESKFTKMENEYIEIANKIPQDFEELEVFKLADCIEEFSDLILDISELWFGYYEPEGQLENQFSNAVKNCYAQLQNIS